MSSIEIAQNLMLKWISIKGDVSYQIISDRCEYLSKRHGLDSYTKPISQIFYPLLYSGVIDIMSNGRYAVTPNRVIAKSKSEIQVVSNPTSQEGLTPTSFVGVYTSANSSLSTTYKLSITALLSQFPTIAEVVTGCEDVVGYNFESCQKECGIIEGGENGLKHYFVDKKNYLCYILDSTTSNPDMLNIATYYERAENNESNGTYTAQKEVLRLKRRGLPILIFRLLLLDLILNGCEPYIEDECYVFLNVNIKIIKALNRIFCNSIYVIYE